MIELKEQLVHTNVAFAAEITEIQEGITAGLTKLMDIIAEIIELGFKPSTFVSVSLIPPVVLILQLIEMTLSSIGNIGGVFQSLGIPMDPYFFLKQYVPFIDWDKFKEEADKLTFENKTRTESDANNTNPNGGMPLPNGG